MVMVAVRFELVGLLKALNVTELAVLPFPVPPPVMTSQAALEDAVQVSPVQPVPGLTVKAPGTVTGVLPLAGTALVRARLVGLGTNRQVAGFVTTKSTVTTALVVIDGEEIVKLPW